MSVFAYHQKWKIARASALARQWRAAWPKYAAHGDLLAWLSRGGNTP